MNDLIQPGVANGLGQEQGVEGGCSLPPGYTYVEVKQQCAAYHINLEHPQFRCIEPVVNGSSFCESHDNVKLCKASGVWHYRGGQNGKFEGEHFGGHMVPHSVHAEGRTERADFCSDRCRNLWRDTNVRRERKAEIEKLERGERSERYTLIKNYYNSGATVLLNKETGRLVTG